MTKPYKVLRCDICNKFVSEYEYYLQRGTEQGVVCNSHADGGGATKTKLMYSAFISFNQLKEYLSLLAENGLIQYEDGTTKL